MVIGYTCGVFDLFHVGHLKLLETCKEKCDYLIVGICDDDYVRNSKGREPIFSEQERKQIVEALSCVDEAHIVNTEITNDKLKAYDLFHYNILFSGDDWKGSERYQLTEKQFAQLDNVHIEYLPYTKGISTSEIIKKMGGNK